MGWGMGLFFHAIEVFGYGKNWEERKIKEILRKENLQNKKWD
ncbi:2TM domain-containing protein [Flavobacterium covae]